MWAKFLSQPKPASDAERYRLRYPNLEDNLKANENFLFYTNKIPARPSRATIDDIHQRWFGNHNLLEENHSYIQWIFPIREQGLNFDAQPLQLSEIKSLAQEKKFLPRLLKSYKMMLNFYGFQIKDEKTGELERTEEYQARFAHLNHSFHNYLRITRILKCLGEFDLIRLKIEFILALMREIFETKQLSNLETSCRKFWVEIVRDDTQRAILQDILQKSSGKEDVSQEVEKLRSLLPPPVQDTQDPSPNAQNSDSVSEISEQVQKLHIQADVN